MRVVLADGAVIIEHVQVAGRIHGQVRGPVAIGVGLRIGQRDFADKSTLRVKLLHARGAAHAFQRVHVALQVEGKAG